MPQLTFEGADHILRHALPPAARNARFARALSDSQRSQLQQLKLSENQIERLERILPAIAYYTSPGPKLADVRTLLAGVSDSVMEARKKLESLLFAPNSDDVRNECKGRLLLAIERHDPNPPLAIAPLWGQGSQLDGRAKVLVDAMQEIEAAAKDAVKRMPKGQTRLEAHPYPISLIEAALHHAGSLPIQLSDSASSRFRDIVGICYEAARAPNADPLRAIRAHIKTAGA